MTLLHRRHVLAAGATLASALVPRKLLAADLAGVQWRLPDGTVRDITDYAGRGVVLNFWATWCAPCVAEMPSLDALAAAVRSANALVLPLSSDRGGTEAVQRWYDAHAIRNLPILLDPTGAAARAIGARGIPTTLLIDGKGRERGRLEGGADWASAASIKMVRSLATA